MSENGLYVIYAPLLATLGGPSAVGQVIMEPLSGRLLCEGKSLASTGSPWGRLWGADLLALAGVPASSCRKGAALPPPPGPQFRHNCKSQLFFCTL
jgi:hypothetical protein